MKRVISISLAPVKETIWLRQRFWVKGLLLNGEEQMETKRGLPFIY